jgi:hypothetical protein
LNDIALILFLQQVTGLGRLESLASATAVMAIDLEDSLRDPDVLAVTHTDGEILLLYRMRDFLVSTVKKLRAMYASKLKRDS